MLNYQRVLYFEWSPAWRLVLSSFPTSHLEVHPVGFHSVPNEKKHIVNFRWYLIISDHISDYIPSGSKWISFAILQWIPTYYISIWSNRQNYDDVDPLVSPTKFLVDSPTWCSEPVNQVVLQSRCDSGYNLWDDHHGYTPYDHPFTLDWW